MRRPVLLAAAALALALPAPASAIVNGVEAQQGEFPAQGVLRIDTDANPGFDAFCGGTLIGSRQFLTAARCVTDDFSDTLPEANLLVRLGSVDRAPDSPDDYSVTKIDLAPGYDNTPPPVNDAAVLTLDHVADYVPTRVVDSRDSGLWTVGTLATVLGWGRISTSGIRPEILRKVDVPIVDDARCTTAYGAQFKSATMLCAADPLGTPASSAHDSCEDDWGGPLLVPDGPLVALAGVVSWRGADCGNPAHPGVYTQLGDGPLNTWVHDETPEANFGFDPDTQPQATVPFTLFSTSTHPEGAGYYTQIKWDLDNDGAFDDATGRRVTLTIPSPGPAIVGIQASKPATGSTPRGDTASAYFQFDVRDAPGGAPPVPTSPAVAKNVPAKAAPLATILAAKRPKVKRGRFPIRIRFAKAAPRGTAVIEVYRGTRRIGIARTKVKRGATKRVRVKLTPTGRRILRRAKSHRLKIRVRVRVGRQVLRTKRLTIRG